jgi:hypothetical protein
LYARTHAHMNTRTDESAKSTKSLILPIPPRQPQVVRMVSQLEYKIIAPFDTFYPVEGFEMRALPTVHGSDCCCLGFEFGERQRGE